MDEETKKSLDNFVEEIQKNIFMRRFQALGPDLIQRQEMFVYMGVINRVNKYFHTDYLTHELNDMKVTDSNGCVYNELPSKLPLRKGDENIFKE